MILAKHFVCSPDARRPSGSRSGPRHWDSFNRGATGGVKRLGKDAYRKSICGQKGPWRGYDASDGNRTCTNCAHKLELLEKG